MSGPVTDLDWPLVSGDTVRWWDGSRYRTGRYTGGTIRKRVKRQPVLHALIEERVVTEEGTTVKTRAVHPGALRPSNDGRTVRSRGHHIYLMGETWTTTPPPTRRR
jgi:hypothetical protein